MSRKPQGKQTGKKPEQPLTRPSSADSYETWVKWFEQNPRDHPKSGDGDNAEPAHSAASLFREDAKRHEQKEQAKQKQEAQKKKQAEERAKVENQKRLERLARQEKEQEEILKREREREDARARKELADNEASLRTLVKQQENLSKGIEELKLTQKTALGLLEGTYGEAKLTCPYAERKSYVNNNDDRAHGGPCKHCAKPAQCHYIPRGQLAKDIVLKFLDDMDDIYGCLCETNPDAVIKLSKEILEEAKQELTTQQHTLAELQKSEQEMLKRRRELQGGQSGASSNDPNAVKTLNAELDRVGENINEVNKRIETLSDKIVEAEKQVGELTAKLKRKVNEHPPKLDISLCNKNVGEFARLVSVEHVLNMFYEGRMVGALLCCDMDGNIRELFACSGHSSLIPDNWCREVASYSEGKKVHLCVPKGGLSPQEIRLTNPDCAAPKLLQCAISEKLIPIQLAEYWFGSGKGHTHRELCLSCPKCQKVLGTIACGLEERVNAFMHRVPRLEEQLERKKQEAEQLAKKLEKS